MMKTILKILIQFGFIATLFTSVTAHAQTADNAYTLKPGDYLRVFVFGAEDLSGEFRIDSKGEITIPLIGDIHAEGLNKLDLKSIITKKLREGEYYQNPIVTVEIIALQPFYILGEVKNPGNYEFQPDLNIFKAVAIAGGYTPRASKKIIILRKIHGEMVEIKANELTPIRPGDSIKVKRRFF